jgi:hypothetical protein
LPCSQELASGPYPERDDSSTHPPNLLIWLSHAFRFPSLSLSFRVS